MATNILIVEDEKITAEDIKNSLNSVGYEVPAIVSSGEELLRLLKSLNLIWCLWILGWREMDGIQAAEQIRSRRGIPIIYLTAYSDEKTVQRAKLLNLWIYS